MTLGAHTLLEVNPQTAVCYSKLVTARHARFKASALSRRHRVQQSNRMLVFDVELGAGESKEFRYFNAIAADKTLALDLFEKGQRTFDDLLQHSEQIFNDLISCAFAPGNSEFSGHLLQLFTTDESLWKLYYSGFTCLLFARRASPDSVYGTTYITLGAVFFPP